MSKWTRQKRLYIAPTNLPKQQVKILITYNRFPTVHTWCNCLIWCLHYRVLTSLDLVSQTKTTKSFLTAFHTRNCLKHYFNQSSTFGTFDTKNIESTFYKWKWVKTFFSVHVYAYFIYTVQTKASAMRSTGRTLTIRKIQLYEETDVV
jgi:hypothetical protein